METFKDYVRTHDPGKGSWVELWETGRKSVRPSRVTFQPNGTCPAGRQDGEGFWRTGADCEHFAPVVVSLPPPHQNGIDYLSFTSEEADACIQHLISETPWLWRVGGKASAKKAARQTPGVAQFYEGGNGYWRSSIYKLVGDFATYKRTGIDPRAGVTDSKSNTKRKVAQSVDDAVDEHEYAEEDANEQPPVQGVPVTTESVGVPVAKKLKAKVAVDPDLYKPPAAHFQIFRYAGECDALEKHLKKRHLFRYATPGQWVAIREWIKSKDGRAYLKDMCNLDPEGVQLDHIRPKDSGELNHMYNCYFMPSSVNAHFKDKWDDEKKRYIGERARIKSGRFMRWHSKQAAELVDVGFYKGHLLG